jgi:hypothetical protein
MAPEEIKRWFETNPPPEKADWKPWARITITGTQVFLKSRCQTIRNFNGPLDRCPAWWHLKDFYMLMRRNAQEASSEKQTNDEKI